MNIEHPLLSDIRAGVATHGSHSHHWGELRREVFPGIDAWQGLKHWCAENGFECDLSYTQSSKSAQVQFRKARKNAAPAVVQDVPEMLAA